MSTAQRAYSNMARLTGLTGMSRTPEEGRFAILPERAHLEQSIADILTTPPGTRVMRPGYGSKLPRLVDRPVNQAWKLEVYVAVAEALRRWEPRIRTRQVRVSAAGAGYVEVEVEYEPVGAETGVSGTNTTKVRVTT